MKKFLAAFVILAMLTVQLTAGVVFAVDSDAKSALNQLNTLNDMSKADLLGSAWDFAVAEIGNGNAVTVDAIYGQIQTSLTAKGVWANMVKETNDAAGDGKISKASLQTIIQKLINNKNIVISQYANFKNIVTKSWIKAFLGLPSTATDGDVFKALLPFTQAIITRDSSGKFARNGDVAAVVIARLGLGSLGTGNTTTTFKPFTDIINANVDDLANRINNDMSLYNVSADDVIFALSIYGFYVAPGGGGGGGGGGAVTASTDVTKDTQAINDLSKKAELTTNDIKAIAANIDNMKNLLNNATDDASAKAAVGAVKDTIKDLGSVFSKAATDDAKGLVVADTAGLLNSAASAIGKVTAVADALTQAKTVIQNTGSVVSSAKDAGISTKQVSDALAAVADKVMEKVNVQSVASSITGTTAKAVLSQSDVTRLIANLDNIKQTSKALTDALADSKVEVKVKAVLSIVASTTSAVEKANVELSADLMAAASDKKIDKISVDTGVAKFDIAPNTIAAAGSAAVSLEARKVSSGELSDSVKAIVGSNQVYDFNALAGDKKISTFTKPIDITLPYTLKASEKAKRITVFYINDKGRLENAVGSYGEKTKTIKFKTRHFSGFVAKGNDVTFGDIAGLDWAKEDIETMASKGIIAGIGNDKFDPSSNVTRAQFAAMAVRAFNLLDTAAANSFKDVKASDWFSSEVSSAVKAGIIAGRPDGTFAPKENITRQDIAVIAAKALALVKEKDQAADSDKYLAGFTDRDKIAAYAKAAAAEASRFSIVSGMPGGLFAPKELATRAEAAAFISRLFDVE